MTKPQPHQTKTTKSYHHGDLADSLLKAAIELLRQDGPAGLSMRKLADYVGVSRTAPYHHFKDKNALLCEIAITGFQHQVSTVQAFIQKIECATTQAQKKQLFEDYFCAYIEFADTHAETYDLMYGRAIWKSGQPTEALQKLSRESFKQWLILIEKLQQASILSHKDTSLRVGQSTWATLHGLCRLLIDGIYLKREDLHAMIKSTLVILAV
ncbi:TetR/AcrR family transcriptional regulator [Marinomonas agarivorans]|nr:TetR/AcrR family transcriptional regulator [Marinomonas agarivorans]